MHQFSIGINLGNLEVKVKKVEFQNPQKMLVFGAYSENIKNIKIFFLPTVHQETKVLF